CPYAPGAKGNVATEAVHERLTRLGYDTGLDRSVLEQAGDMARQMRKGE
ncbi:MAG: hydroxymethylglutaryl-CoA lyase, partial [Rhodobacteraceae bacterium]|nr:hydroxymethylglutaryl-CoA lyase [Paracoccaceae bacterium]